MEMSVCFGFGFVVFGWFGYFNFGYGVDFGVDCSVNVLCVCVFDVFDVVYVGGVCDFDIVCFYGCGEEFFGVWLRDCELWGVNISFKWGYVYIVDWVVDVDLLEVKYYDLEMFKC